MQKIDVGVQVRKNLSFGVVLIGGGMEILVCVVARLSRNSTALILLLCALVVPHLYADESRYESGLLRRLSVEGVPHNPETERNAIRKFFGENFSAIPTGIEWRELQHISDSTHSHRAYGLFYKDRRVEDEDLKIHYSKKGQVDYATSSLENFFELNIPANTEFNQKKIIQNTKQNWIKKFGKFEGLIRTEPIIWTHPVSGERVAAFVVKVTDERPLRFRNFVVEEVSGRLLEERKAFRRASVAGKAYTVSPFNSAVPSSVTLTVDSASALANSFLHVRREENTSTPTLSEVVPGDYTTGGFSTNPALYDHTCTGGTSACPNQAFDSVNVFHHLTQYRNRVASYLTTLGATITFSFDPINVIISPLSIDLDGDTQTTDETNNALYVGQDCRADGTMPRCFLFLRPGTATGCSSSTVQLSHLAREAVVVAHEYQHYVTDMATSISFSSSGGTTVGDALHEGYSDYLGASYVSEVAGRDVTLVGEYALENCSIAQRQLNTVRVFTNTSAEEDPHLSGLSFASALWKLRTELGVSTTDLIALKSLFFLSRRPGFVESVEALVKADQALNGGSHVTRIRQLLYDEVHFIGGNTGVFRDSATQTAEVGFRGCAGSGHGHNQTVTGVWTLLAILIWLGLSLFIGRVGIFGKNGVLN